MNLDEIIKSTRPIPDFEGYRITTDGEVFSLKCNRFLKGKIDRYGYKVVALSKNGKSHHKTIHRLVAMTYIENPLNLPCVNHINENKLDNRVENLEWVTVKENNSYGTRNKRISDTKCRKPVVQILPDGTEIKYKGVKDAWRQTGIRWSQIANVCKGKTSQTRGTKWRYANE